MGKMSVTNAHIMNMIEATCLILTTAQTAGQRWTEVKPVSERQEKKRRQNLKLEYIASFNRWIASEPPKILFWRWRKWRDARPVFTIEKGRGKNREVYICSNFVDREDGFGG